MLNEYQRETLQEIMLKIGDLLHMDKKEEFVKSFSVCQKDEIPPGFRKRPSGQWEGRFYVNGKRYSVYAKTLEECIEKKKQTIENASELPQKMKFGKWLEQWIEVYKAPRLKPKSLLSIETCVKLHIPKTLKEKRLAEISAFDIQAALNTVPGSRSRQYTYTIYSEVFRRAYALRYIEFNPMLAVDSVKHETKNGVALTLEEQNTLVQRATDYLGRFYLLCLYTGCRRSELLSLDYSDINRNTGLIHIRGTKTKGSDRHIPLFPFILPLLEENGAGLVCPFSPDYVTRKFKEYCPGHKLHDLRHTFATRCLEAGVPLKVVQTWLGHAKVTTTADIYSHVTAQYFQKEAQKLTFIFCTPTRTPIIETKDTPEE